MGNSDPAWLAKDPAAQKHLGKYKKDAKGLVWYVYALDTSRKGDVARLRRIGCVNVRRNVPLAELERDYKDVAEDKQTSPSGEVCSDTELQATLEMMSGGPVKVTVYEDKDLPNMLWDPAEMKDAGELAHLPTFFVDANPGDERPIGVVVVLGDKTVRVKVVGIKDPRDLSKEIPAIELRPLQEPGKDGEPLPAVTAGPLAVLAFRNPRAIATFMCALDHIEKKLTGESPKFVVQFEKPPPCKEGCKTYEFRPGWWKCKHGTELPGPLRKAERLVDYLMNAHAMVIEGEDEYGAEEMPAIEESFQAARAAVVDALAQPFYPRVEAPTEEGWYWRAHRLWEVIRFGDGPLVFMQAGITREVSVVSEPWFGPVPPPESWK